MILLASFVKVFAQTTDDVLKVETTLVSVPVIVSDRNGRYIPGLKLSDFSILQDGVNQPVSFFATESEPLNVAILLDTSRSTENVLDKIKDAAKDFIKLLQPTDRAMIVSFDFEVNVVCPLTSDQKVLKNAVKHLEIGKRVGTVLRDAVEKVVTNSFANVKGRKAIILLTDGKDRGSYPTKEELLHSVEESDTMIYSIFYETTFDPRQQRMNNGGVFGRINIGQNFPRRQPNPQRQDRIRNRQNEADNEAINYLQSLADSTAGRFYQKDITDIEKTFALIADELRQQYRLGYYPPEIPNDTDAHRIKVKVNMPDVVVRSRTVYRPKPSN
jgi:VWFA-related protein